MSAQLHFEAGRLNEAVAAATDELRNNPTRLEARTTLFELLSFSGDLDRAEKQLDVVGQQDAKSEWEFATYFLAKNFAIFTYIWLVKGYSPFLAP